MKPLRLSTALLLTSQALLLLVGCVSQRSAVTAAYSIPLDYRLFTDDLHAAEWDTQAGLLHVHLKYANMVTEYEGPRLVGLVARFSDGVCYEAKRKRGHAFPGHLTRSDAACVRYIYLRRHIDERLEADAQGRTEGNTTI